MADPEASDTYRRLGGDAGVAAVVDDLYQRIVADAKLAPFFEAVDVDAIRSHQRQLVAAAIGGPADYDGRDLRAAHAGLAIEDRHVTLVCEHLAAALEANGAAPRDVTQVLGVITRLWAAQAWPSSST